ncbi:MAG: hypothetical protein KDA89_10065 [Planctomycetaceae bacterium]|nr:hypothetical protein [Planctomycetaceae bacterium]
MPFIPGAQFAMNYLAHGFRFLQQPLFLAGTAVPDWLSVVNRRVRARQRLVAPVVATTDCCVTREVGSGILQHHRDDDLFHRSETFQRLEAEFSQMFRQVMPDPYDHRPGFLGHILVELLLDATLADRHTSLLDDFYAAMAEVDENAVQRAVNMMATQPTDQLARFIRVFRTERFLYDYLDDRRLLLRLNQVMRRVQLPPLNDDLLPILNHARIIVTARAADLLAPLSE